MRRLLPFSSGWEFSETPLAQAGESAWGPVDLPHSFVELPLEHEDDSVYQKTALYRKAIGRLELPPQGSAWLDFEGVAVSCSVSVNGKTLGSHAGPYTPFSVDITTGLDDEGPNLVEVEVDGRENPAIPPFGKVVDYLTYAGIYRGVSLRIQNRLRIENFHARPGYEKGVACLSVSADISGERISGESIRVEAILSRDGRELARVAAAPAPSPHDGEITIEFPKLEGLAAWELDNPCLYDLELRLFSDGRLLDAESRRIGFRSVCFKPEGFFLNGRKVFLRGLNRHQSWPYVGYAMGSGGQRADAEILKGELGLNIVRTSHYPQSRHFLDACDELGLLVMEELPGWQHIGDRAWQSHALSDLEAMIRRDRNRPSIVLWGVRINESADSAEFYRAANLLAARLDPDRQRGGVRNFAKSEFLEDVYTYNDFSFDGRGRGLARARRIAGRKVPYLVTEHTGHMYPAKRRDGEERQAEHARRHARVLDAAMGAEGVSGAIGWCAFDYPTHKEFGSPGRICHHGVMDAFRLPKFAAALYSSQTDPGERIVLEPASWFSVGERSALRVLPIEVYTNCDELRLYRSGDLVGSFTPDFSAYPHLLHPPIVIDDLIGNRIEAEGLPPRDATAFRSLASKALTKGFENFSLSEKLGAAHFFARTGLKIPKVQDLVMRYGYGWPQTDSRVEIVGFVKGKEAIRKSYDGASTARGMRLVPDAPRLRYVPGGEWNALRIVARVEDGAGNPCPSLYEPIAVEVSGPVRLIGPALISLTAGSAAFWVASKGLPGQAQVAVRSGRFGAAVAAISVETADA